MPLVAFGQTYLGLDQGRLSTFHERVWTSTYVITRNYLLSEIDRDTFPRSLSFHLTFTEEAEFLVDHTNFYVQGSGVKNYWIK